MSAPQTAPTPGSSPRIQYLGFKDAGEHREYRLAICTPDGTVEYRFRIAIAAFAGRVQLQDGPDVCYKKLLRAIAAGETVAPTGETPAPEMITIDDAELASYREAHTRVVKRRAPNPARPPRAPFVARTPPVFAASRVVPVAPVVPDNREPGLEKGQRVRHATFGLGVTTSSNTEHTVVVFDETGSRTFITSLLKLDVLSAPDTWETGPRGKNRPQAAPDRS